MTVLPFSVRWQSRLARRSKQARRHIRPGRARAPVPVPLTALLTPDARARFNKLRPADQLHLVRVADNLAQQGAGPDLVAAGLLHDIGKAHPGIRIRLADRAGKVLLARLAPHFLGILSRRADPPLAGAGLWALARHAQAGADLALEEGYSERVQWLIAHHERRDIIDDPELRLLIAVDDASEE